MVEDSEQIGRHIQERRSSLHNDISELEQKAKDAVDWRVQIDEHPGTMLGLAFGAGMLLSALFGGPRRSAQPKPPSHKSSGRAYVSERARPYSRGVIDPEYDESASSHAWDNLKGALVGLAVTRCERFLDELLPGFSNEYRKAEARSGSSEASPSIN